MNWFEELTGFPEPDYATVRKRLAVDGHERVVRGSSRRYGIGELELVSLGELRERAVGPGGGLGRAGTVAACLLIESGVAPSEAIRKVRTARSGAIETREQERYIMAYRQRFGLA
jgi:hypothetical protein